jgi:predicted nucleic acid-binding protein
MPAFDTNVLVRYIVQDDPLRLAAAKRLISRCVAGGSTLFVPVTVVLEVTLQLSRKGSADFADCIHVALATQAGEQPLRTFDKGASTGQRRSTVGQSLNRRRSAAEPIPIRRNLPWRLVKLVAAAADLCYRRFGRDLNGSGRPRADAVPTDHPWRKRHGLSLKHGFSSAVYITCKSHVVRRLPSFRSSFVNVSSGGSVSASPSGAVPPSPVSETAAASPAN